MTVHNGPEMAIEADIEDLPRTAEDLDRAKRVPRVKTMRRALSLTQEEFAERYMIPVGTLRDWEQGQTEPDAAGRAYLRAIRGNPEAVALALRTMSQPQGEHHDMSAGPLPGP